MSELNQTEIKVIQNMRPVVDTVQTLQIVRPKTFQAILKRGFDLLFSMIALILLTPVYILLAALIFLIDGRPIFFRQERPGLNGKPFRILKFRTMTIKDSALQDSERITRIGNFLRSFSLDELPEFWNVWRGDMSLVGPRPLLMAYLSRYDAYQAGRHKVRPGITGWAQINGRNLVDWPARFEFDLWYVDHATLWLDIKILFLTLKKVFLRDGIAATGSATMHEFQGNQRPPLSLQQTSTQQMAKIEMSSADISEADIAAVVTVLRSGRLSLGPLTLEFEQKMARYIGVRHAIAVSSGTAALHLIIKAMGIGQGDEVLVPSFTFAASVNAILYVGATPVFVDVREDNFNLDPQDLIRKLTDRTKAVMAVDIFGHPVDWDEIKMFARDHHLKIIDDCCEALGAEYKGKKVGSFGDAGAFAFYPNKQITTGEGGMIVTNDDEIARLARSYRNQGRDEMGEWLEHPRLGYNYRLDEMSAALGASQLSRIDEIVDLRAHVATMYSKKLAALPDIRLPQVLPHVTMSWFVYVITLANGVSARDVIRGLADFDVPSRAYFNPIHSQSYILKSHGTAQLQSLPQTQNIAGRTIALPFHNRLSEADVDYVVSTLAKVLARCQIPEKKAV